MTRQGVVRCTQLLVLSGLLAACNDPTDVIPNRLDVTPGMLTVDVGTPIQLTASLKDAAGQPMVGRKVSWVSAAPSIAIVSATGLVTGLVEGQTSITAASGGIQASVPVVVLAVVRSVTVLPASADVDLEASLTLQALAVDGVGHTLRNRAIVWQSDAAAVATVSADGTVNPVTAGTATISATIGQVRGQATVRVMLTPAASITVVPDAATLWVGESVQLTGLVRDVEGRPLYRRALDWQSSAPLVATVNGTGRVTAVAPGSIRVTAAFEAQTGVAVLTVQRAPALTAVLAAGFGDTCGIADDRSMWCWGSDANGQLGAQSLGACSGGWDYDDFPCSFDPGRVLGGIEFAQVTAGRGHTCGLDVRGRAYCWSASSALLGAGTASGSSSPVPVSGDLIFTTVAAGSHATCGVTSTNQAWCWGFNYSGVLGDGTSINRLTPTAVAGGLAFSAVSAGADHVCGLTTAGTVYCWGGNRTGQLGDPTVSGSRSLPGPIAGSTLFLAVSAGGKHTCGITASRQAFCWGDNTSGQLGNGFVGGQIDVPVPVAGGRTWETIQAGNESTCGLATDGAGWCWGANYAGQLGNGSQIRSGVPVAVVGPYLTSLAVGGEHACGVSVEGAVYCWGLGSSGQLGAGTGVLLSSIPIRVTSLRR